MKTLTAALLCLLVAGCAAPLPSATPTGSAVPTSGPTTTPTLSPSPSPSIVFRCISTNLPAAGATPAPSPGYCSPSSETAVVRAVASLGYPVKAVTIGPFDMNCGGPFTGVRTCPVAAEAVQGAYVSFVGTDEIAAVDIGTQRGGSGIAATVVLATVPPVGWSIP